MVKGRDFHSLDVRRFLRSGEAYVNLEAWVEEEKSEWGGVCIMQDPGGQQFTETVTHFGAHLLFMSKFQDCAGAAEIRLSLIR